jgi:2-polyprenyl-3-methyl-5-hydroxy-6-metoxy-1,4-benzoquinol methylase
MKPPVSAQFTERTRCINCASSRLRELSRGKFVDEPLSGFILGDPWGESPLPYLQEAEWVLVHCSDCAQVFHRRILTEEWNEIRFSRWMSAAAMREFEERLAAVSPTAMRRFESARQQVAHVLRLEKLTRPLRSPGEPVRVLDFGCGWGNFLSACRHFGFDAVGVDRAAPRIENAIVPILPSLDRLEGRPAFHVITLFEVLEHLDDPAAVLKQLHPLLMAGGILVLETPDCRDVTGIRSRRDYLKVHPLEHINAFTHQTLKSIAERQGYACIARGAAHVHTERKRLLRTEARHLLGRDGKSTELYFRKL